MVFVSWHLDMMYTFLPKVLNNMAYNNALGVSETSYFFTIQYIIAVGSSYHYSGLVLSVFVDIFFQFE